MPDGPLLVMGDRRVQNLEGGAIADEERRLTLCRCGRTRNQPSCDNSHPMARFRSREFTAKPHA